MEGAMEGDIEMQARRLEVNNKILEISIRDISSMIRSALTIVPLIKAGLSLLREEKATINRM
jgi:hypothetical protein